MPKHLIRKFGYITLLYSGIVASPANRQDQKPIDLSTFEKRYISQQGEDGVLEAIFEFIGADSKYYVEFGAGDGHVCSNTKYLREARGWKGLLLDGRFPSTPLLNLYNAYITAENICSLFKQYKVPCEFDLISIDIDRNDFYVWNALCKEYSPRVVVIEFNKHFGCDQDKVIKYDAYKSWNGTEYFGASILAFYNLGKKLGYSLVYQESNGVNLFFIRNDILQEKNLHFKNMNDVKKIYNAQPGFPHRDHHNETFITSEQALTLYP